MPILQAILLGLIQGLTEFIPISSTAHLVIAIKLLGVDKQLSAEQITAFNAVIQLGTLIALLTYFASDIRYIITGFITDHWNVITGKGKLVNLGKSSRLGYLIILGTLPIVFLGLAFKKIIEGVFTKNLYVIGSAMILLALFLLIAELAGRRSKSIDNLTWFDSFFIGLAQALALIPGSSRSGTTITAGLFLGLEREAAARFSFLLSIPAVGAAGLLELYECYNRLNNNMLSSTILATVVAAISGYAAIAFLMRYLKSHSTHIFIGYRLFVGASIFVLLALRIIYV